YTHLIAAGNLSLMFYDTAAGQGNATEYLLLKRESENSPLTCSFLRARDRRGYIMTVTVSEKDRYLYKKQSFEKPPELSAT
ncbi:MAG: hypothetical protein DI551_11785, partial [Micavibrio aeruginosavorus]